MTEIIKSVRWETVEAAGEDHSLLILHLQKADLPHSAHTAEGGLGGSVKQMTHPLVLPLTTLLQLDICDAVHDHLLCPGHSILYAGDLLLGPVACTCDCHSKKKTITQ